MRIPPAIRAVLLALIALALIVPSLAACSSADDDQTIAPTAFTNPTTGEKCAPWVSTPHETDGSGLRACDFPIPIDQPVRQPGMSDADYLLLGGLFGFGLGHHDHYFSGPYYDNFISPAYVRYPGYVAYGYGHRPLTRYTSATVYNTTVINHVNTKYAAQEKSYAANPKTGGYKTANGKSYTGATAPKAAFKGTNITAKKPAGDAVTSKPETTTPKTNTGSNSKSVTGGNKSYTGSNSSSRSSSGSSSRSSSSGGSRSSGGGRR